MRTTRARAREFHRRPDRWDAHDGPMPLDYFVWLMRGGGARDRGRHRLFRGDGGEARPRPHPLPDRRPAAARDVDAKAGEGRGDHAPALRPRRQLRAVSVRDAAPAGSRDALRHRALHVRRVLPRRLRGGGRRRHGAATSTKAACAFTTATRELAPGVSLHLIGGHTMGLQAVRVSDAARRGRCSPRTQATSTPTWSRRVRSRSSGRWPTWWMATGGCAPRRVARAHHPGPRPAGDAALSRARGETLRGSRSGWTEESAKDRSFR